MYPSLSFFVFTILISWNLGCILKPKFLSNLKMFLLECIKYSMIFVFSKSFKNFFLKFLFYKIKHPGITWSVSSDKQMLAIIHEERSFKKTITELRSPHLLFLYCSSHFLLCCGSPVSESHHYYLNFLDKKVFQVCFLLKSFDTLSNW